MSRPPLPEDGRARRKIEAMRRVQDAALDLFEARGYEAVTIEEIAKAAGVGPATIYRGFETKERIVIWDEYDPMLLETIADKLKTMPLLDGVEAGLVEAIDRVYSTDKRRILRRTKLLVTEPALIAAAAVEGAVLRDVLAALFIASGRARSILEASVASHAILGVLEASVKHWALVTPRPPMRDLLTEGLAALRKLLVPPPRAT